MELDFYPRCNVCKHPDHLIYEAKILKNEITASKAAQEMGVDGSSLSRHMNRCVAKRTAALTKPEPVATVINALNALAEQYQIVKDNLEVAIEGGKISEIATMLKEGRKHIELHARLTGQISGPQNQINLLVDPEFVQLKQIIVNSLDPIERSKLSARLLKAADAAENVELADIVNDKINEVIEE
jgi:hypothetical protein